MTPAQSEHGGAYSPDSIYGGPVRISRESSGTDMDMDLDDDEMDRLYSTQILSTTMVAYLRPYILPLREEE